MKVAVLHPGQMGATVAAAARRRAEVAWVAQARSEATAERASRAGVMRLEHLGDATRWADLLISVCPPDAAAGLAESVASLGYRGLYLDANAVAPSTARRIARCVEAGGASFLDGGIIGPPAHRAGTTRLYVSGSEARTVVELFADSHLEALALAGDAGAASALKMSYAAYTKGTAALLLAIRALARTEGVDEALLAEWARSQTGLAGRSERSARATAPKAWRFAGEMDEIAHTFREAGLPGGFHQGAREIYRRLASFKNDSKVELDQVLQALIEADRLRGSATSRHTVPRDSAASSPD